MPITEQEARNMAVKMLALAERKAAMGAWAESEMSSAFALTGILAALVNIEHHLQQISAGLGLLLENK